MENIIGKMGQITEASSYQEWGMEEVFGTW